MSALRTEDKLGLAVVAGNPAASETHDSAPFELTRINLAPEASGLQEQPEVSGRREPPGRPGRQGRREPEHRLLAPATPGQYPRDSSCRTDISWAEALALH